MKRQYSEDIIGQKFNKWVVLDIIYSKQNHRKILLCRCDCGNIRRLYPQDVIQNRSRQCKMCASEEHSHQVRHDLTGKIFGKWKVIRYLKTNKYRKAVWLCVCECGRSSNITSNNLLNGSSTKCISCNQNDIIKGRVWSAILNGAKYRNIPVLITIDEAKDIFIQQNGICALSGQPITLPNKATDKYTASLDRIDSTKPYTKDNCQWVHKTINRVKWILNNIDFIKLCNNVSTYQRSLQETICVMKK